MFHSDARGTLTLRGAPHAITGAYRSQQGQSAAITARIEPSLPHVLDLTIDFSPSDRRTFRLACHTDPGASSVVSGTMVWGDRTLGAMMLRTAP